VTVCCAWCTVRTPRLFLQAACGCDEGLSGTAQGAIGGLSNPSIRAGTTRFFCGCFDSLTSRKLSSTLQNSKRGLAGSPELPLPQTRCRGLFRRKNQTYECSTRNSPDTGRQEVAPMGDDRPMPPLPVLPASTGAKELLASLRPLPRDRSQARPHGVVGVRPAVACSANCLAQAAARS